MLETLVTTVVLLVIVALGAGIGLAVMRTKARDGSEIGPWPFSMRRPLSDPEQVLYFRLCEALPDHIVLAQVGLSRFIAVRRGHDARAWHNRINRMSVDFLVCSRDASVVAAIELDDTSHRQIDRVLADDKKEKALDAAGVRLIRWNVNAMPDAAAIHVAIGVEHAQVVRKPATSALTQPPGFRPA